MIHRWLTTAVFFYPAWILAMLLLLALPSAAFLHVENWEILPLGILPQSAEFLELRPIAILVGTVVLLVAVRAARVALLLCCASMIAIPYWIFTLRDGRLIGAVGLLIAFAGLVESQRNLSADSYWKRMLEAWAPLASGAMLAGFVAFGTDFWYAGAFAAIPLALSACVAAAFPQPKPQPYGRVALIALGIGMTILCRVGLGYARDYQLDSRHARTLEQLKRIPQESEMPMESIPSPS